MGIRVGEAIYSILSSTTSITDYTGTSIYPVVADAETKFPFIIYKRDSIEPASTKDKYIYLYESEVEIMVASDNYKESIELAELVINTLQGKSGIYSGIEIQDIRLIDSDEDFADNTFIQTLKFKITVL